MLFGTDLLRHIELPITDFIYQLGVLKSIPHCIILGYTKQVYHFGMPRHIQSMIAYEMLTELSGVAVQNCIVGLLLTRHIIHCVPLLCCEH